MTRLAAAPHEGLRDDGEHVGGDADARVAHLHPEPRPSSGAFVEGEGHVDVALVRVLDGVLDEVAEDLGDPRAVSQEPALSGREDLRAQPEPALMSARAEALDAAQG